MKGSGTNCREGTRPPTVPGVDQAGFDVEGLRDWPMAP